MKLPHQDERSTSAARSTPQAPTPSVVDTWLTEASNEEPGARSERLKSILEALRRGASPPSLRFRATEACRLQIAELGRELDQSLAGLSLPLPPEKEALSRRCAHAHWLLADCYLRVASELSSAPPSASVDATQLSRACYWGIASLGEHILINCSRYAKIRQGVWLDIHKLYNIAHAEGLHTAPVALESSSAQSVEHAYKRVLLLGLSDPYRHPFRVLARVYRRLDTWVSLASLTTSREGSGRCLFTVDPALDRPGMPALSRSRIRPEFDEKWLLTRPLVDRLKQEHEELARRAAVHRHHSSQVSEELDSLELLRRLIVRFGLHPIRNRARTSTYRPCDVVIGLKPVCIALNGFKPLRVEASGPTTAVMNRIQDSFGQTAHTTDAERLTHHWEIADESDRGLRIVTGPGEGAGRISVGEPVAFRTGDSDDWKIGHIHWVRSDDRNILSLGIRKVGARARPVLIARLEAARLSEQPRHPALLLLEEASRRYAQKVLTISLLCARSLYLPTGTYLLRHIPEGSERVMEAANVLSSTRSFVWFKVVKPQANTKEKVLDLIYPT